MSEEEPQSLTDQDGQSPGTVEGQPTSGNEETETETEAEANAETDATTEAVEAEASPTTRDDRTLDVAATEQSSSLSAHQDETEVGQHGNAPAAAEEHSAADGDAEEGSAVDTTSTQDEQPADEAQTAGASGHSADSSGDAAAGPTADASAGQWSDDNEEDEEDEDTGAAGADADSAEFPVPNRPTRDSIHIHRNHINAIHREKELQRHNANADADADAEQAIVEQEPPALADVVQAVVDEKHEPRPMPAALPNEVQFEVTYFTQSLGLRLKWQNRRIVVTGSVPPFDEKFAEQIAAQPQIDEGDFLTAVGDFHCVGFSAFSDAVALIKSSPRPLTLTFRRDILKKNRAMIVTENVWANFKKKGMSLLGKVKKFTVDRLGSPTNGHGGVAPLEGGGSVHTLPRSVHMAEDEDPPDYMSPRNVPPDMSVEPERSCMVPTDAPKSPTGISRIARSDRDRQPGGRLVFADQAGGRLAEVHYSEGLHYSTKEQRQSVRGDDGCVIS